MKITILSALFLILSNIVFAFAESGIKIGDWLKLMVDPKKSKETRAIFIGHSIGAYAVGQQMVNTARGKFDVLRRDQFFFAGYMSTLTFSGWCYRQIYTIKETLNNFSSTPNRKRFILTKTLDNCLLTFS